MVHVDYCAEVLVSLSTYLPSTVHVTCNTDNNLHYVFFLFKRASTFNCHRIVQIWPINHFFLIELYTLLAVVAINALKDVKTAGNKQSMKPVHIALEPYGIF